METTVTPPTPPLTPPRLVVMGVAGCGKSSLARTLADALGWDFIEGDDHHSPENKALMRAGIALTDADRAGWLSTLGQQLQQAPGGAALSCSALKRRYRDTLRQAVPGLRFVFLDITPEQALQRVRARAGGHYFPPQLVDSQFDALERPLGETGVLCLQADATPTDLFHAVADWLALSPASTPLAQP